MQTLNNLSKLHNVLQQLNFNMQSFCPLKPKKKNVKISSILALESVILAPEMRSS